MANPKAFDDEGFDNIFASLELFAERAMDVKPALQEITALFQIIEAERFANSGTSQTGGIWEEWKPPSDAWIQRKPANVKGKTLVYTGALANAAMFPKIEMTPGQVNVLKISVDTAKAPYGEFHQDGNTRDGVKREFVTITETFELEATLILMNYLYSDNPAIRKAEKNYEGEAKRLRKQSYGFSRRRKEAQIKDQKRRTAAHEARRAEANIKREAKEARRKAKGPDHYSEADVPLSTERYAKALATHFKIQKPDVNISKQHLEAMFRGGILFGERVRAGRIDPTNHTQSLEAFNSFTGINAGMNDLKAVSFFIGNNPEFSMRQQYLDNRRLYG